MTKSANITMASSKAADPSFKVVVNQNKSKWLKAVPEQKIPIERTHSFPIHVYFTPPMANTKFNPIASMHALLVELLKHEPSIAVTNPSTKTNLILATDQFPMNEEDFKEYFMILTDMRIMTSQQHIIIGCHMLSERTVQDIKYDKNTSVHGLAQPERDFPQIWLPWCI